MGRIRQLGKRLVGRLAGGMTETSPAPVGTSAPPTPPPPVSPAPSAPEVGAWPDECRPADLAELRAALGPGRRVRVVNHWASWCDPCVEEIPLLVGLHLQLEDRADFLGVCWELFDDDRDPIEVAHVVADFAANRAVRYPSLLVTVSAEALFSGLEIAWQKIPQTWVIAQDGTIIRRFKGVLTEEQGLELVALVTRLADG